MLNYAEDGYFLDIQDERQLGGKIDETEMFEWGEAFGLELAAMRAIR
jgi:hypothetical protein